jgi:hypothetical protein
MFGDGHVDFSMRTDQGRVRDHNEDFVAFHLPSGPEEESQNGQLYIVADGVGGSDAGEVASRYATERTIHHFLANSAMDDWGERLRQAMLTANTELRKLSGSQYQGLRMATTMVATVLHDDQATLANVGDSRPIIGEPALFAKSQKTKVWSLAYWKRAPLPSRKRPITHVRMLFYIVWALRARQRSTCTKSTYSPARCLSYVAMASLVM